MGRIKRSEPGAQHDLIARDNVIEHGREIDRVVSVRVILELQPSTPTARVVPAAHGRAVGVRA